MIFPCIPITFIDNFMKLLYVTFFLKFIYYSNPGVHFLDALFTGTSFEALARQENIYTVERLTQTCYDVYIIWVSVLSGCPY